MSTFNILSTTGPSMIPISALKKQLTSIIMNPKYHDLLAVVKSARNGLVYGTKVRFPQALVMAILFGVGSWQVRAKGIYKATRLHAFNLMKFAAIFNSIRFSLRRMRGGQETPLDYGIAGLVGGFLIFGDRNPVNEQISLYICSRLVAALLPRAEVPANFPKGKALPMDRTCFKYFSAACWGAAMFLWTTDGGNGGARLGQGLLNSSNYIYKQAEVWTSLKTFLWHNQ